MPEMEPCIPPMDGRELGVKPVVLKGGIRCYANQIGGGVLHATSRNSSTLGFTLFTHRSTADET
jgi:hypothetical protein